MGNNIGLILKTSGIGMGELHEPAKEVREFFESLY